MKRVFNDVKEGRMTLKEFKAWVEAQWGYGYLEGWEAAEDAAAQEQAGASL